MILGQARGLWGLVDGLYVERVAAAGDGVECRDGGADEIVVRPIGVPAGLADDSLNVQRMAGDQARPQNAQGAEFGDLERQAQSHGDHGAALGSFAAGSEDKGQQTHELVGDGLVRGIEDMRLCVAAGFVVARGEAKGIGAGVERFNDETVVRTPADGVEGPSAEFAFDAAAPIFEGSGGK